MSTHLRLATIIDRPLVEAIVRGAYSHYVPRIGREPGPMLDDYGDLISNGRVHVLEDDSIIKGILVLIPEEDSMLLDNVAVAPSSQGKGFGRRLLEFAEQIARQDGYRSIRLYTNEAMTENIALYLRIGYLETHRGEAKGLRRVYMLKTLD